MKYHMDYSLWIGFPRKCIFPFPRKRNFRGISAESDRKISAEFPVRFPRKFPRNFRGIPRKYINNFPETYLFLFHWIFWHNSAEISAEFPRHPAKKFPQKFRWNFRGNFRENSAEFGKKIPRKKRCMFQGDILDIFDDFRGNSAENFRGNLNGISAEIFSVGSAEFPRKFPRKFRGIRLEFPRNRKCIFSEISAEISAKIFPLETLIGSLGPHIVSL